MLCLTTPQKTLSGLFSYTKAPTDMIVKGQSLYVGLLGIFADLKSLERLASYKVYD